MAQANLNPVAFEVPGESEWWYSLGTPEGE